MSSIRRSARLSRLIAFMSVVSVPLALAACSVKFDPNGVMSNGLTNENAGAVLPGRSALQQYDYSQSTSSFLPPSRLGARRVVQQGPIEQSGFFAPTDLPRQPSAVALKSAAAKPVVHRNLPGRPPVLVNVGHRRMIVVRPGDSLVGIAFATGSTVNELMEFNGLSDRQLRPGQRIWLP